MFLEVPDKAAYPDYYEVITKPIDMRMISRNIKTNVYKNSVEAFIADIRIMFANCRKYNEEGSDIVGDANSLEKALNAKIRDMGVSAIPTPGRPRGPGRPPKSAAKFSGRALGEKLKQLVDTVREFKDGKGRQLSLIFLRLPNIKEFPDYYEVIKKPIGKQRLTITVSMSMTIIGLVLVHRFRKDWRENQGWWLCHPGRMLGGFCAHV